MANPTNTAFRSGGMGYNVSASVKPADFANSLAEAMENQFWTLLNQDQMKTFEVQTNSNDARDRRRLFVAIAQGIAAFLQSNPGMMPVQVTDSTGATINGFVVISCDNTLLANQAPK